VAKPSDKFKVGKWVRVMPSPPTEKQLLRVPETKRVSRGGTVIMYEHFVGGIYQIANVCDGDFTICLNIEGRGRWFDPDWLITVDEPERRKDQDIRLKEGLRQMEAADRRRDEIFKQMFSPWWKKRRKRRKRNEKGW
jgi:hypothetical protein